MHARLDHGFAASLRAEAGLDRRQDLRVRERQLLDVEAIEKGDVDRLHPLSFCCWARGWWARHCRRTRPSFPACPTAQHLGIRFDCKESGHTVPCAPRNEGGNNATP